MYHTSLENTLSNMKSESYFYKTLENQNDGIFWSGLEVRKLEGTKRQLGDDDGEEEYDFNENIQSAVFNKIFLKDLDDDDTLSFINMLKTIQSNQ